MRRTMRFIFSLLLIFSCSAKAELINFSPTFEVENELKFDAGAYVLKIPEKLKVYTFFRNDYWLFNVAKDGQYLFTIYIGNFPNTLLFEEDPKINQTSFKLDNYPDIDVPMWSCAVYNQLKCSQTVLIFPRDGATNTIQLFYSNLTPEMAQLSNSIIQTIKGPGISPKTKW